MTEKPNPACRNCDGECDNCTLKRAYDKMVKETKETKASLWRIVAYCILFAVLVALAFKLG